MIVSEVGGQQEALYEEQAGLSMLTKRGRDELWSQLRERQFNLLPLTTVNKVCIPLRSPCELTIPAIERNHPG